MLNHRRRRRRHTERSEREKRVENYLLHLSLYVYLHLHPKLLHTLSKRWNLQWKCVAMIPFNFLKTKHTDKKHSHTPSLTLLRLCVVEHIARIIFVNTFPFVRTGKEVSFSCNKWKTKMVNVATSFSNPFSLYLVETNKKKSTRTQIITNDLQNV